MKPFFVFLLTLLLCSACLRQKNTKATQAALQSLSDSAVAASVNGTTLTVLPAIDTMKNGRCVLAFVGCDETHLLMSDFNRRFYEELAKAGGDQKKAFNTAIVYFVNTYPDSPVMPVLTCSK